MEYTTNSSDLIAQKPFIVVNSFDVYNLPLFEDHLVIDCRNSEDYQKEHIATAFNIPPPIINITTPNVEQVSNLQTLKPT